jgi:hypothetical protein
MFKLPDYKSLNFSGIKFPTIDLAALDFSGIDFPALDFSGLDVNALRDRLPSIDAAKLTEAVRDAAYIAIGLGVTSIERAQARREQFTAIVTDGLDKARGLLRNSV